jgi:selenocysteine-specific translation elongation factor
MNSLNFVILGNTSIAKNLGKKGTTTDISIYDRKTADAIMTWTIPITYPDKIQSLIYAINLSEFAILNVEKLDMYTGEQILALDHLFMKDGFILHSNDIDQNKLKLIVQNTNIKNYEFMQDLIEIKKGISNLRSKPKEGPLFLPVDHVFDVKGVGTVVLGVIKQGKIKVPDKVTLLPSGKTFSVKSIQMHDDSVPEANSPARVGLALKGVTPESVSRGDVICEPDNLASCTNIIKGKFSKNPFFKEEMQITNIYQISVGLQLKPAKIKLIGDDIEINLHKPIVVSESQNFLVIKPDAVGVRICGRGFAT